MSNRINSRARRLAYARIMKKQTMVAIDDGKISTESYAFKSLSRPMKCDDTKWRFKAKWEDSLIEPICVYGNEQYLREHGAH